MRTFLFLLIISCNQLTAQNRNSIWCFGDSSGIDFSNLSSPNPITSAMDGRGSCVSIADSSGSLIFYANTRAGVSGNTTLVWNKMHQQMQNGDSIVGEAWYSELIIIPFPDSINKYYLFSLGSTGSSQLGLYYSVIDINLNAGLGAVTQKNIQILNIDMADCLKAVKHGNGKDWWLIAKPSTATQYNRFYIFLISSVGISLAQTQDFNNAIDGDNQKVIFSSDGHKFMQINTLGLMCQYDFDRCTSIISNPDVIFVQQSSNLSRVFWDGAYSSNDSLFYVTTTWYSFPDDTSRFLQYNLFAPDIPLSCDTLLVVKHPVQPSGVRLGPDKKIYMTCFYDWGFPGYPYPDSVYNQYNMNLSVVNDPNLDGLACNFQPFSFYLGGKRTYFGLPNNPDYSLGPLLNSICDTVLDEGDLSFSEDGNLFPNPASEFVSFISSHPFGGSETLKIYSLSGQLVRTFELNEGDNKFSFNLNILQDGIYFIVDTKSDTSFKKFKLIVLK